MTMTSLFDDIIQDHLRLKEQNAELERYMPIDRYKGVDPFENHPLFKTEEQARIEDTLDGNVSIAEPEEDLVVAHAQAYGIEPTHRRGPLEPLPGLRLGRLATGLLRITRALRAPVAACPNGCFRALWTAATFEPMTTNGVPHLSTRTRGSPSRSGSISSRGQDVLIIADLEQAELTRAVARAAFEAGARYVDVKYVDARLTRIRADLSPDDGLGWSPPHTIKQIEDLGRAAAAPSCRSPAPRTPRSTQAPTASASRATAPSSSGALTSTRSTRGASTG